MAQIDWENDERVRAAAAVAHTFSMDPLVVLHGYDGARRLEHEDFRMAFEVRHAAHNIVCGLIEAANRKAAG